MVLVEAGGNLHSADETGAESIGKARQGGVEGAGTTRVDDDRFDRSGPRFVGGSGAAERLVDGQDEAGAG